MPNEDLAQYSKEQLIQELINSQTIPLRVDQGGVVRIGKTRISLDLIVEQYQNGMTPEDMVRAYDTLELADVYGAIAFYLRHPKEVRAYLKRRTEEAEALRTKIEAERPPLSQKDLQTRRTTEVALLKKEPTPP